MGSGYVTAPHKQAEPTSSALKSKKPCQQGSVHTSNNHRRFQGGFFDYIFRVCRWFAKSVLPPSDALHIKHQASRAGETSFSETPAVRKSAGRSPETISAAVARPSAGAIIMP